MVRTCLSKLNWGIKQPQSQHLGVSQKALKRERERENKTVSAQRLSFIFGWNSKWPLVLPAVLRHEGNIFIMAYIIPKHSSLHGNNSHPSSIRLPLWWTMLLLINCPWSINCAAPSKTLHSARPAATRMFRAPASPLALSLALVEIFFCKLCDQIPGFREKTGTNWRGEKSAFPRVSVFFI